MFCFNNRVFGWFTIICVLAVVCLQGAVGAAAPVAFDVPVFLTETDAVTVDLYAEMDGQPVPPGVLSYIITSLPEHGRLFDPADESEIQAVPHELASAEVDYKPCVYYSGADTFTYIACDGGAAECSDAAAVTVFIDLSQRIFFEAAAPTQMGYSFGYKTVRSQFIYPSSIFEGDMLIERMALNFVNAIGEVDNLQLSMALISNETFGSNAFVTEGLQIVYASADKLDKSGWYFFELDTPFAYDGQNNLLLEVIFYRKTGTGSIVVEQTSGQTMLFRLSNSVEDASAWEDGTYRMNFLPELAVGWLPEMERLAGDLNVNCRVGMEDLMLLLTAWPSVDGDGVYDCRFDLTGDGRVDLADFAVLASQWMLEV